MDTAPLPTGPHSLSPPEQGPWPCLSHLDVLCRVQYSSVLHFISFIFAKRFWSTYNPVLTFKFPLHLLILATAFQSTGSVLSLCLHCARAQETTEYLLNWIVLSCLGLADLCSHPGGGGGGEGGFLPL